MGYNASEDNRGLRKMKLIDAYARILKLNQIVFRTDDISELLVVNSIYASKILGRLAESGEIVHIGRGLWALKNSVTITLLARYITAPFPNYISLQSALYQYGIISQIPGVLYLVSPARRRTARTPVGTISIHHIQPSFFFGYRKESKGILIATQEKALIDFLYLSPARSLLFRALPEIEIPENFSYRRAESMISRIKDKKRRSMVKERFGKIVSRQGFEE
jgi:predicted transcriptional regulator of viral defense system